ncbi:YciI family protein [Salinimicrobium terrae]|uniref:YciI family protein n=1 Tax=Salinimicrobium terrae TaxID=470866 RepID=UPI00048D84C4|nr:YciI family protein [Salinimicrobium terrae]
MKRLTIGLIFLALTGCKDYEEDIRGIPGPAEVEAAIDDLPNIDERDRLLKEEGYQTFLYEEEDSTYLMQQYFIVFLKSGTNRAQDSATAAVLQKQHLAHLSRMASEGYISLAGPLGDDGNIRGIAVYNIPTIEMADSLARLDPMVEAGRLEVEIHPWWAAKGSMLK